ncbi:hypothetical protein CKAN_02730700 [Cinnamomum micranthum f. kanehirae]|uniref:Uncharacterized protein n=1 Tax=Cinnamomum micranthum f. kanehirae TaxID=337451 RepID=A0A443Q490_9MAGN|nr:hypothetical protein CKAN_02730700 [Cinnamomum micranthum f. kanehirae]
MVFPFSGRLLHHAALTLSHHLKKKPFSKNPSLLCARPNLPRSSFSGPRLPLPLSPHLHHAALTLSHHLQKNPSLLYEAQTHLSLFLSSAPNQHEFAALHQEKSLFFCFPFSFCQNPSHQLSRHLSQRGSIAPAQISSRASSVVHWTIRTALFSLDWQRTRNASIFSSFSELLSPRLVPLFSLSLPSQG